MTITTKRWLSLTAALLICFAGFSQKKSKSTEKVLFSVDNQDIYASEFKYLYQKNNQAAPAGGEAKAEDQAEAKIREYLDLVVAFKLKVAEARLRGIDTTEAFVKEFTTYRDELKKPFVASPDDLDRLVKEVYSRMQEEVKAAHILINVSPDAPPADTLAAWQKIQAVRQRVVGGEDFGNVAAEISEDPTAKMNKGSLGYFSALAMVYQFEDAAFKTKVGEVSQPVRTRFGYHIIHVSDRRKATGEVEVSHILLGGTDDKTKNLAFDIYGQFKGGRKWEDLVREYSVDGNTKERGGKLPPFGVGALASVPEFENMAFSLQNPGDVSDPFKSNIGWHIIRLERKIPVPTFEEAEPQLKRRVGRDERLQISQANQLNRRKASFGFSENVATKTMLNAITDSTLQQGEWNPDITSSKNDVLFTIGSKHATLGEFVGYAKALQRPSALPAPVYMKQLYDQFIDIKLGDAEDEKLQAENADYRNLVREYKEGIMFFSIMEKEVWNKGSADTVGQRAYYEAHKDKYQAGDRVYARMYSSSDKAFIQEVREKASRGDTISPADAKKFKSVSNFRAYAKGENKVIDMISWSIGLHEAEADGMYYLVEIERLLPPGIRSYQEARASVISDYQEEIEKQWIASLKAKHKVKMNKKTVKTVVQELQKK